MKQDVICGLDVSHTQTEYLSQQMQPYMYVLITSRFLQQNLTEYLQ